ncbi:TonB-dependent receptor [Alteromonas lipotrueiana]|uniref:TonB-dependent receptor n=1 Tax=Alteromonas lipotrueiana TaxID=2803815 RepID=UPI001C44CA0B|nr:TonB-dependent receptor [Alteromonas lipotrueiana]
MSYRFRASAVAIASALFTVHAYAEQSPPQATQPTTGPGDNIERVEVTGSQVTLNDEFAGGQVARGGRAGILGNLDFMASPFTATNFTEDLVRQQQSKSIADVLQNDPVVRVARGFGNFQEVYVVRGFPVYSDDMTYNGLYGILPRQYVAAELLERVEVFRGANTFLNGAAPGGSGLGGSINVVPKRAGEAPLNRLSAGFESQGHGYIAADVSRRFGDEKESTGVRVNLVERDGETAVNNQDRSVSVMSLGVDYKADALRVSADLGYQDHHIEAPRPSVTPLGAIPAAPEASTNFAQDWTYTDEEQLFGAVRAEYDFTSSTSAWLAMGFRSGEEANVLANPTAFEGGAFTAYRFDNTREDNVRSYEAGVSTRLTTGPVRHTLAVSASLFSADSKNAYAFSSFSGFSGNLYDPVTAAKPDADFFVGGELANPTVTLSNKNKSVAVADSMSLWSDRLLVTLGARLQTIQTHSYDYTTQALLSGYDESRLTPVVGVVYRPVEQWSLYANYIEGLVAGDVAPAQSGGVALVNAGEVFEPYRSRQVEAGIKYDGGKIGGTLSAYSTSKPTSLVVEERFTSDGEQQNRGIELSVFGLVTENLRLLGGITYVDAQQSRTQDGIFDGLDVVGVPDLQLNINAEWNVTAIPGLTLEARGIYTDSQYADVANTYKVASSHRLDLGARYSFMFDETEVDVRVRVENVFDNNYWASVGGFPGSNYLVLSDPRTLKLSASVRF